MDQELLQKIEAQNEKLDALQRTVSELRRYFLWTLIVAVVVTVLPLIGLVFVIPQVLGTYSSALEGL